MPYGSQPKHGFTFLFANVDGFNDLIHYLIHYKKIWLIENLFWNISENLQ